MNFPLRSICTLQLVINLSTFAALPADKPTSTFCQDLRHFGRTGIILLRAPCEFSTHQWLATAGVLAGTATLFTVDRDVRRFAGNQQTAAFDHLFSIDRWYGNAYTLVFTGSLYGIGLALNETDLRLCGLRATEAFVYGGLLTTTGKVVLGRRRPRAGDNHLFFKPLRLSDTFHSLPSGHATVAFAVATVCAKSMAADWGKIICYGSAGLVGCARVYHNAHWLSDVVLGSVIGYVVADRIMKEKTTASATGSSRQWLPWVSVERVGLAFCW